MSTYVLEESALLNAKPAEAYDFLTTLEAFRMFRGHGVIPGISMVEWGDKSATTVGARGHITTTDGHSYWETVRVAERGQRYAIDMHGYTSAFRLLIRGGREEWRLTPKGEQTRLDRRFSFYLRSPVLWPVARIIERPLRRAIRENHEAFVAHFRA